MAGAASGAVSSVGGGAYAVNANINPLVAPVTIGALPSVSLPQEGGGPYHETLASTNVAGLVRFDAASVSTEGNSGRGSAASSARLVDVSIAGVVSASSVRSRCSATADDADGSATVAGLVIGGMPISTLDAGPNTTITTPVGRVILNEQRPKGTSGIIVNAVRVTLDSLAAVSDVVLAQSRCAVNSSSTRAKARAVRRARHARTS